MNVQAEINWIIEELKTIKDPLLIEAFKNLLTYRKNKESEFVAEEPDVIYSVSGEARTREQCIERYEKMENSMIKNGNSLTVEELEKEVKNW